MWVKAGCTVLDKYAMCDRQRAIPIGSSGSNLACGKDWAIYVRIATFSVSTPSSVSSAGTLPRGFTSFRYSGAWCSPYGIDTSCVV